ncbi:ImmA/IrrE family metallo-endopeptidase [Corynebacterium glucuronolyticum]|nr:ImmA/IrrE family metallo-endopeptidase [Corynebacterium glucuronolyticum]
MFHELAHILTADYETRRVDREKDSAARPQPERKADNWAANALLDGTAVDAIPQPYTAEGIVTCASDHSVSPAIVVGSLRRQGKVPRIWGADLIRRFEIS